MKPKKNTQYLKIADNSYIDNDKGVVTFKNGLVITDDTEQFNGTKYDIKSMDIDSFPGKLTADHSRSIESIIGIVNGIKKIANKKVVIDSIKFAIEENALARFAYNLLRGGFLTDFSIETIGPWPDDDGVYHDSQLVGLSAVVVGNNKNAKINQIAINSIDEAKELGLDTSIVENNYLGYTKGDSHKNNKETNTMLVKVKNSRNFAVSVKFKNEAGEEVTTEVKPGETVEVPESEKTGVETQVTEAKEPAKTEGENSVATAVANALAPLTAKMEALEKKLFDNGAQEPGFSKARVNNEIKDMGYMQRHANQINGFLAMKRGDSTGAKMLNEINKLHLEQLQEKGIVDNTITLADMGNFVISPELITEIQGKRSNFRPLLDKVTFRETLSLQMAWLKRSGDIDMQPVTKCDDGADGNLKPIKEYTASINTKDLEELAAVTPVCNAATRFLAADLLGDVAAGYRTDFDRKLAQLVIARLQQAVNTNGNSATYDRTSATTSLTSFVDVLAKVQETVENGFFVLNTKSKWQLIKDAIAAGISGPLAALLSTGNLSPILGESYIVVPNELMPTLNTAETKSFTVDGATVTINKGLFYADLGTFTGRTSGGLMYDLSTEAAYEDGVSTKSAFQRNEVLLRGSFFRGGAMLDTDLVSAMNAAGIS